MRSHLMLLVALLLCACGGDDEAPPPNRRGPFGGAVVAAPTTTTATTAYHHSDLDTLDRESLTRTGRPTTPIGSGGTAAPPGTLVDTSSAPQERNLSGELSTALGSPASCLDAATARTLHGRLTMQITITVTPSGGVTRASATGASLPESTLACMQTRALGVHLAAPVPGAPRSISTSLTFDVTTTDDRVTHETPVWHQPGAVAEPGHVLPAIGAEGRPEGALAPDSVLPAVGATGRPEGSVRPDIVLPGQGGGGTIWPSGALPPPVTQTTH